MKVGTRVSPENHHRWVIFHTGRKAETESQNREESSDGVMFLWTDLEWF